MRTGPRPLALHLGMAAAIWGGGACAGAISCLETDDRGQSRRLALQSESARRMGAMLRGILAYHEHPYRRNLPPLPIAWHEGTASLFHAASRIGQGSGVLLVPSLVNGAAILDLSAGRSFLRWLATKGFKAYLMDWGDIMQDPALATLDGVIAQRLAAALEHAVRDNGGPVHVLGYCMGGLLALALAHLHPEKVRSLTLLASPWEFEKGPQPLGDRIKAGAGIARSVIHSLGRLPVDWIQTLFASVDPLVAARKFSRFAQMDPASEQAQIFVAVEDWLNEGPDLPAAIAEACIRDWYIDNAPARGLWQVRGTPIRAQDISRPSLVVASARDRLVPLESSAAAAHQIPGATLLVPDCGHIGMIAGAQSVESVWQPIARWLAKA